MHFGVGGHGDFKIVSVAQPRNQFCRPGITLRMGYETATIGRWWITAQRHNMAHARLPVLVRDFCDVILARRHAGQVRGGHQIGFLDDPADCGVGPFARRPTRAVCHRDKAGAERGQLRNGVPQLCFHLLALGREEFERHSDIARQPGKQRGVERPAGVAWRLA